MALLPDLCYSPGVQIKGVKPVVGAKDANQIDEETNYVHEEQNYNNSPPYDPSTTLTSENK